MAAGSLGLANGRWASVAIVDKSPDGLYGVGWPAFCRKLKLARVRAIATIRVRRTQAVDQQYYDNAAAGGGNILDDDDGDGAAL